MNIEVTRDNVTILEQSETPHENEYKITTCYFTFDEFTSSFQVKRAIFTILSTEEMYETDIINNQCDIPSEVLEHEYETVKLGVYGYNIGDNDELLNRFSPSYAEIIVPTGSYKEGALSPEPITPSQYDLYSQALQEGLQEVDDKLDEVVETVDSKLEEVDDKLEEVDTTVNNKMTEVDDKLDEVDGKIDEVDGKIEEVDTAITETNNLNLDVSDKVDGDVTVTLTKKDATTKSVVISDGTSLQFRWQGTSLGIKTDDMEDYIYVDLQGIQGVPGPQGEPFRIKKTYSSVAEMNADFDNMEYGDYVMIASTVEVEDNAKLYTRGESQWIFITDFSGATGIKGETGATPNIQIGTVTSGSTPSVTRTGTNENPVLNFVLQPGPQGQTGQTGATGNGIASITKTSTSGLVDTYTITFTSGNTTTFNVTNGNGIDHISLTSQSGATKVYTIYFTDGNTTTFTVQDGEVTQEVFDEEIERANMIYNAMPKVSDEGTDITINNTAECPVYEVELSPSELEQETTSGKNLFNASVIPNTTQILISNNGATITMPIKTSGAGYTSTFKKLSDLCPNLSIGETYYLNFDRNLGTSYNNYIYLEGTGANTTWVNGTDKTITNDLLNANVVMYANNYNQGETTQCILTNFRITKNSTDTWEKYTGGQPSPNPDYPQQIHFVSGENSVKVGNKNIFDGIFELGIINGTTGLDVPNSNYIRNKNYIPVEELTNYKMSTDSTVFDYFLVYEYKEDYTYNLTSNKTVYFNGYLTTNSGTKYIRFRPGSATTDTNIKVMVEKGTTASSYTPHQEQTYPISLGDLEYCKIGDYEDLFYKATESDTGLTAGKWYLKKNIGKVVLDGSENWQINGTGTPNYFYYWYSGITIGNSTPYCNCYSYVAIGGANTDTGIFMPTNYIRIRNANEITIENFKNQLSTTNVIVYYPLATTTYTLLSDTLQTQLDNLSKAISYQEQTNVSQTNNDLPFVIKLSAIRDLSGIFELIQ